MLNVKARLTITKHFAAYIELIKKVMKINLQKRLHDPNCDCECFLN